MLTTYLREVVREIYTLTYRLQRRAPERDSDFQLFMLAHEDEIEKLINELVHKIRVMAYVHVKERPK